MEQTDPTMCPHCGVKMLKWQSPPESSWGLSVQYVCFNDDCPYYVKGWEHMSKNYAQKASYRHRYNPDNDETGPLPCWSPNAHRANIVEEEDNS